MPRVAPDYVPSYRLHKSSGCGVVTLNHRDYKLGRFGTAESKSKYHELISKWIAGGRRPLEPLPQAGGRIAITVAGLLDAFVRHAATYYRRADGTPTSEPTNIAYATKHLRAQFGATPAEEFTPLKLQLVRDAMIGERWARTRINRDVKRIQLAFRWAVSQEIVPVAVSAALGTVTGLRKGRSSARESSPVRPVALETIAAVKACCTRPVAALLELQLLTGARPGELLGLRTCDVDRTGSTWAYRPAQHKTAHRSLGRTIFFGPRAQVLLAGFIDDARPDTPLFSPRDGNREARHREATKGKPRRMAQKPNVPATARQVGTAYRLDSYRRALARAADDADAAQRTRRIELGETIAEGLRLVPRFHPHQVRHTVATDLRKRFGIQAAQLVLGHETLTASQVYAEVDLTAAEKIAVEVG